MDNNNLKEKLYDKEERESSNEIEPKFIERTSLFSQLYSAHLHYKSIANLFLTLVFLSLISSTIEYYYNPQIWENDIQFVKSCFHGFFTTGLGVFTFLHLCYMLQWLLLKTIDSFRIFLALETLLVLTFIAGPLYALFRLPVGTMLGFAIAMEHMRFIMKFWSLVAENYTKPSDERATFIQAMYFVFAPAMVFQKSYPRSKERRWYNIWAHAGQIFLAFYVLLIIVTRHFIPGVKTLILWKTLSPDQLSWLVFKVLLFGTTFHLSAYFMIFHAWFNLFAEFLRFGDRQFYGDWWNSDCSAYFMPRINYIVSIFLKEYIYKPVMKRYNDKSIGFTVVTTISCFFHEYPSSIPYKFFLPLWMLMILPQQIGAIFRVNLATVKFPRIMFTSSYLTVQFLIILYCIEYWSREYCPSLDVHPWVDPFVPYFIYCQPNYQAEACLKTQTLSSIMTK